MSIDLDTRVAIRHPDLGRLVQAVVDADSHDEADWIEWKSGLDLSTKKGCFSIARTILGMANRMPEGASRVCEGLGYIVVGAEPGNLAGVVSVDPADLDQVLEPWLGGVDGPRYMPAYVLCEGRKVLVVVVEAPRDGDPIYSLRKEFDGYRDGDVFVRKPGRTDRANSGDLKALTERAASSGVDMPDLEVTLVGDVPLPWCDTTAIDSVIDSWVEDRMLAMERNARAEDRRRNPESTPLAETMGLGAAASLMADYQRQQAEIARMVRDATRAASFAGFADEPDKRTLDEYLSSVESWGERAKEAGAAVLVDRYLRAEFGLIAVRVHNPSGRYLPKVMVEVYFEWHGASSPEPAYPEEQLPAEPRPFGQPTPSPLAQSLSFPHLFPSAALSSFDFDPRPARSWTEEGSVRIMFDVGDLRQEDGETSDDHYLFLLERPSDGYLRGTWKATIPEVHGVIRGTLDIPVHENPVELRSLLDADPAGDGL